MHSGKVLDMTPVGYVNISVRPEGRGALQRVSYLLSHRLGRRVSMSEALIIVEQEITEVQRAGVELARAFGGEEEVGDENSGAGRA